MQAIETNKDPFGYIADLRDVLLANSPVPIIKALARCEVYCDIPYDMRKLAEHHLDDAIPEIREEFRQAIESAKTLGKRYDETENPHDANDLIRVLIEFRTEALGLEMVGPIFFQELAHEFDFELRKHKELLASVSDELWYYNLRNDMDEMTREGCWWLNLDISPVEFDSLYKLIHRLEKMARTISKVDEE